MADQQATNGMDVREAELRRRMLNVARLNKERYANGFVPFALFAAVRDDNNTPIDGEEQAVRLLEDLRGWKELNDIAQLGGDHATAWQNDLKDVDDDYRSRLREQMYKCIQLDKDKYPAGKIVLLSEYITVDLVATAPYLKLSTLLQKLVDGSYGQQPSNGRLIASRVVPEVNVLVFDQPLMKLASASTSARRQRLGATEVPLTETDIKPNFSAQGWDVTNHRRLYSFFGFDLAGTDATPLDDTTTKASLTGYRPDTVILNCPDLYEVLLNGGTTSGDRNTEARKDRAKTYARNAMNTSAAPLRVITATGFLPIEIDAAVSEVEYDPQALETRITLNGWHITARSGGER